MSPPAAAFADAPGAAASFFSAFPLFPVADPGRFPPLPFFPSFASEAILSLTPPLMVVVVPDFFTLSPLSLFREDRELLREMLDEEGDFRPRDEPERFD